MATFARALARPLGSSAAAAGGRRAAAAPLARGYTAGAQAGSRRSAAAGGEEEESNVNTRAEQGLYDLYARAVEPKPVPVPPLAPAALEAASALGRTYVKNMWRRHHVMQRDLSRKLKLKWAAIYALPTPALRAEALAVDVARLKFYTRLATTTPPLKGFHALDGQKTSSLKGVPQDALAGLLAQEAEEEALVAKAEAATGAASSAAPAAAAAAAPAVAAAAPAGKAKPGTAKGLGASDSIATMRRSRGRRDAEAEEEGEGGAGGGGVSLGGGFPGWGAGKK